MSLFSDILKGLPENAVLRSKVNEVEAESAALKTENAILKDDNRTLKIEIQKLEAEIVKLNDEIHKLTHAGNLHETEIKILVYLADEHTLNFNDSMVINLNLKEPRLHYFLETLRERKYISYIGGSSVGEAIKYDLTQRGREFLFKNNLI